MRPFLTQKPLFFSLFCNFKFMWCKQCVVYTPSSQDPDIKVTLTYFYLCQLSFSYLQKSPCPLDTMTFTFRFLPWTISLFTLCYLLSVEQSPLFPASVESIMTRCTLFCWRFFQTFSIHALTCFLDQILAWPAFPWLLCTKELYREQNRLSWMNRPSHSLYCSCLMNVLLPYNFVSL